MRSPQLRLEFVARGDGLRQRDIKVRMGGPVSLRLKLPQGKTRTSRATVATGWAAGGGFTRSSDPAAAYTPPLHANRKRQHAGRQGRQPRGVGRLGARSESRNSPTYTCLVPAA